jgi:hypothetical protein
MGNAILRDGIGQRLRDVLLANHIFKPLWPIFSGYDLI